LARSTIEFSGLQGRKLGQWERVGPTPALRAPLSIAQAVGSGVRWDNPRIRIPVAAGYLARRADDQTSGQEYTTKDPSHVGYWRFKMSELFHVSIFHILLSFLVFHRPPITPTRCAKSRLLSLQKAVIHIGCVDVGSRDRPCRVVGGGECALAGACARSWDVKHGDSAVGSTEGTVIHVVCVDIIYHDRLTRVDGLGVGALAGACARAWRVNRRDGAAGRTHQAMIFVVCVCKVSGDRACRVDGDAAGALSWACARAWGVKRGDSTVRSAHEPVTHNVCIADNPRGRPGR